jgi:soluble lytic murein transglycosylase-like protein
MLVRVALALLLYPIAALGQTHPCRPSHVTPLAIQASLRNVFEIAGKRLHIDPDLAQAITQIESGFDPRALSPKGAQGLMQLMPNTSAAMHVVDPFNPYQSIYGGMEFLRTLANDRRFAGNPYMVLVAYNAGPNRETFPEESHRYANNVLALYQRLKAQRTHQGRLIEPTRSLDHTYLGGPLCERVTPTPHAIVVGGQIQPSRNYR